MFPSPALRPDPSGDDFKLTVPRMADGDGVCVSVDDGEASGPARLEKAQVQAAELSPHPGLKADRSHAAISGLNHDALKV